MYSMKDASRMLTEQEMYKSAERGDLFVCNTTQERNMVLRFFKDAGYKLDKWCEKQCVEDGEDEAFMYPSKDGSLIVCYATGILVMEHQKEIVYFDQISYLLPPQFNISAEEFKTAFAELIA